MLTGSIGVNRQESVVRSERRGEIMMGFGLLFFILVVVVLFYLLGGLH